MSVGVEESRCPFSIRAEHGRPSDQIRSSLSCLSRVSSLVLNAEVVVSCLGAPSLQLASGLAVVGEMRDRQHDVSARGLRRFPKFPEDPNLAVRLGMTEALADGDT